MPLAYPGGTISEHLSCREDAVAFDVSHLGTVRVSGPDARARLQSTLTNDLGKIAPGRAQYTHLLDEADGSVLDDIIVWWIEDDRFDVMPNASNTRRVRGAIGGCDITPERAVIAVQGPRARSRLAEAIPEAAAVGRFRVGRFEWEGFSCVAAGTGYTGEDGVECCVPADAAVMFWETVLETGVRPAGLGARDTLRLEAALPLHGHELGPGITPLQAGLEWVVAVVQAGGVRRPGGPRAGEGGGNTAPAGRGGDRGPAAPSLGCRCSGRRRANRRGDERQLLARPRARHRVGVSSPRHRVGDAGRSRPAGPAAAGPGREPAFRRQEALGQAPAALVAGVARAGGPFVTRAARAAQAT